MDYGILSGLALCPQRRYSHWYFDSGLVTMALLPPSGQNLADSVGNPWGLWLLVEGIYAEIWVVRETRIHMEIQGKFLNRGWNEREFPQTCKHFYSPKKNDIKSSLEYFHITWTLPMSLNCDSKFFRQARGKFPHGDITKDFTGKGGGNIYREISPSFPQGWSNKLILWYFIVV